MSLFGFMGDDDMFLGNPMHAMNMQMRSMNRLMNSFMPDPFNMLAPFDPGFQQNALMERNTGGAAPMGLFGFPAMPNMNRLLNADIAAPNGGASFCSSSVITMSSGPDGRPQIYQATSSTKTGPGGIRETRKTVQDSTRGIKKMAIGHHIGERAHIIEKEQDLGSGQLEERQEFINLDEEQAEDFDREFTSRAHMNRPIRNAIGPPPPTRQVLSIEPVDDDEDEDDDDDDDDVIEQQQANRRQLPAPSHQHPQQAHPQQHNSSNMTATQSIATSLSSSSSANSGNTTIDLTTNANDDECDLDDSTSSTSFVPPVATTLHNINHDTNNNNVNNGHVGGPTRRPYHHRNHHHHHHHHVPVLAPRRPLRTPTSSPLATTSTPHMNSAAAAAATLSVHPHPYNNSAARRNYRPKHTKQHQESHANGGSAPNDGNKSPKHAKK